MEQQVSAVQRKDPGEEFKRSEKLPAPEEPGGAPPRKACACSTAVALRSCYERKPMSKEKREKKKLSELHSNHIINFEWSH